jgi:streptogramin lyase
MLRLKTLFLFAVAAIAITGLAVHSAIAGGVLLASGFNSDQVHRYDATTGAYLGDLGPGGDLDGPLGVTVGPDGRLYVSSEESNKVLRYDRQTFAYIDEFIFDDPGTPMVDETGGLLGPTTAVFGPDGNLYVASFDNDSVIRYNGQTGAFIDVFVPSASNGLNGPDAGMIFGIDGHLYVPSFFGDQVMRFDGGSGAFMGVYIPTGSFQSLLRNPRTILFRYGCNEVFVNNEVNGRVLRYNATTGAFIDRFVIGFAAPTGMAFGPDKDLYVASIASNSVVKFSGLNGANLGTFIPSGSGGLNGVVFIRFLPMTGDANCDGLLSIEDLDGFVELLVDPAGYAVSHPNCDAMNADVTDDGAANGLDIAAFVKLILCG